MSGLWHALRGRAAVGPSDAARVALGNAQAKLDDARALLRGMVER